MCGTFQTWLLGRTMKYMDPLNILRATVSWYPYCQTIKINSLIIRGKSKSDFSHVALPVSAKRTQQTFERSIWSHWALWTNKVPFCVRSKSLSPTFMNVNANHDINCRISIISLKLLPSSKSFYGQLLSVWPSNPTTSPRAFRSSGFNEPRFQLKLHSCYLLLICNASFV